MSHPRQPKGEIQYVEQAANGDQLFVLSMDQEETIWLLNQDKIRLSDFVSKTIKLINESKKPPCPWYRIRCR